MSTTRIYIGVCFRFFQFVGNVGCFATSVNTLRPYNAFILTVTVLNFIYNCYIWFGVPIIGGLKAYNGILLGGEISFFFLYIGSSMFQAFAGYTDDWTEDDFGFSFNPYCYYASWAIGVNCAALYIITFIMYVCWGLIPASRYGFSTGFFERPPFKFGCLVFDKSQVDHNCEDNKDIDLESMQHSTSNNTGTKQNEVEKQESIVF